MVGLGPQDGQPQSGLATTPRGNEPAGDGTSSAPGAVVTGHSSHATSIVTNQPADNLAARAPRRRATCQALVVAEGLGTIVVVEDDPNIADLVDMYLRRDGFRVVQASSGESGLQAVEREHPRLVVVDIGLPDRMDGLDLCRSLRHSSDVPIVILTARDSEVDRVLGLELGADDYVTKPFSPRELLARVRAILRRTGPAGRIATPVLEVGDISIDVDRHEVRAAGALVPLTAREFDLLTFLAEHQGLVLSRRQILDGVWGSGWVGDDRTVDVHVRQLRKKLGSALSLSTVWGVGYRLG
jgi:DNA-binding response OmpR family regulator